MSLHLALIHQAVTHLQPFLMHRYLWQQCHRVQFSEHRERLKETETAQQFSEQDVEELMILQTVLQGSSQFSWQQQ